MTASNRDAARRRDPSLPMNFVNRRKLILWVTFAGRRDDDAGRIVNSSGAGVYLFYRERQPAKRGFHQRLFSRAFGLAVSTSIAVCQIGALEQLHSASALAVACILPG